MEENINIKNVDFSYKDGKLRETIINITDDNDSVIDGIAINFLQELKILAEINVNAKKDLALLCVLLNCDANDSFENLVDEFLVVFKKYYRKVFKNEEKIFSAKEIAVLEIFFGDEVKKLKTKIEIFNKIPKDNFYIYSYISLGFLAYCAVNCYSEDGFYILLRLMITTLASLVIYREFKINNQSRWIIVFGIIALIFNPIKMVTFSDWLLIDFATFCLILVYLFKNKLNSPCGK